EGLPPAEVRHAEEGTGIIPDKSRPLSESELAGSWSAQTPANTGPSDRPRVGEAADQRQRTLAGMPAHRTLPGVPLSLRAKARRAGSGASLATPPPKAPSSVNVTQTDRAGSDAPDTGGSNGTGEQLSRPGSASPLPRSPAVEMPIEQSGTLRKSARPIPREDP